MANTEGDSESRCAGDTVRTTAGNVEEHCSECSYVLITPARNEAALMEKTIEDQHWICTTLDRIADPSNFRKIYA
jgi:hypothetical protein